MMKKLMNFYRACKEQMFGSQKLNSHLKPISLLAGLAIGMCDMNAPEYVDIPDSNFERRLIMVGVDNDGRNGKVLKESIDTLVSLNVGGGYITSLAGIEAFTALESFDCSYNRLRHLDLSKNLALKVLDCSNNQLDSLDLSKNAKLLSLEARFNGMTKLNLEGNPLLENLECDYNLLDSLDVSKNIALEYLDCARNRLKSIDLGKNSVLTTFYCAENKLNSLNVSQNTALITLSCGNNFLKELNVVNNTALTNLSCYENQLKSIDVMHNKVLRSFYCYYNEISSLDLSQNLLLYDFACYNNYLKNLDISKNTALDWISCSANPDLKSICVKDTNVRFDFDKDEATKWVMDCHDLIGIRAIALNAEVVLYPNPSHGVFSVEVSKPTEAEIVNVMGSHVASLSLQAGENAVSLDLRQGLYYLKMEGRMVKFTIE